MVAGLAATRPLSAASRVRTAVVAGDPVSEAGVAAQLRFRAEVDLVVAEPAVVVVVCEIVDGAALAAVRGARDARVVLVAAALDGAALLAAVEAGVCGVVLRAAATGERLGAAVVAAASGEGTMPPDLLGRLMAQVGNGSGGQAPARGLTFGGLTRRELEVLGLLADGCSTGEVARRMAYSERTIKNTIHDVTTRLQLRNRTHAVAYAVREGLI